MVDSEPVAVTVGRRWPSGLRPNGKGCQRACEGGIASCWYGRQAGNETKEDMGGVTLDHICDGLNGRGGRQEPVGVIWDVSPSGVTPLSETNSSFVCIQHFSVQRKEGGLHRPHVVVV